MSESNWLVGLNLLYHCHLLFKEICSCYSIHGGCRSYRENFRIETSDELNFCWISRFSNVEFSLHFYTNSARTPGCQIRWPAFIFAARKRDLKYWNTTCLFQIKNLRLGKTARIYLMMTRSLSHHVSFHSFPQSQLLLKCQFVTSFPALFS